ncbi:insulinase family protein [Sanguibacter hominis ATCC BAA-789]|uniref:Insulinase family protein n=1 Tax=Sanguibacter hominis ATCC BAA-789 TaxID=1312740 RepID=A0A9X5IPQ4_9MICO|nr:insulinase family protein [Sanguibacter hominis]NKX91820.1 insulinase family protein [Sanguibacter hominis ATCC BAA-789]
MRTDPSAYLVLAVGYRDASPAEAGLSHLVEHLVMRHVDVPPGANASSGPDETVFWATGPEQVRADFLLSVCEALEHVRTIDDDALDIERRTIVAEIGREQLWGTHDPFSLRFGLRDLGVLGVNHGRLLDWTAAEVRAFAERHLHAGAATLVLTDEPWDGIRLPLPTGPAPVRNAPEDMLEHRIVHRAPGAPLLWTAMTGGEHASGATAIARTVLERAVYTAARTRDGSAYAVEAVRWFVGAGEAWHLEVDVPPHACAAAVRALLETVDRLTTDGPTSDELDAARRAILAEHEHSGARIGRLVAHATLELLESPRLPVTADDVARASLEEVRAALHAAAQTAVLTLPLSPEAEDAVDVAETNGYAWSTGVEDPEGRSLKEVVDAAFDIRGTLRGRATSTVHNGKFFSPARGATVAVCDDRLVLMDAGFAATLLLDELELVGRDSDGDVELVTSRGGVVVLHPAHYRGLPKKLDGWIARAPRALVYDKARVPLLGGAD